MKKQRFPRTCIISFSLLISTLISFSQNFEYSFSGNKITLSNGTDYYSPMSSTMHTQIIGNNFFSFWNSTVWPDGKDKIFIFGTDFTSLPFLQKNEGQTSYLHNITASTTFQDQIYIALEFYNQTTIDGQTFTASGTNTLLAKFDQTGKLLEGHILDYGSSIPINSLHVSIDNVFFTISTSSYSSNIYRIEKSNYNVIALIDEIDVYVTQIHEYNNNLYFAGNRSVQNDFTFGSTVIPAIASTQDNSVIGYYSFESNTYIPHTAINIACGQYDLVSISEFVFDTDGTLFLTGSFGGEIIINNQSYYSEENFDAQFIFSLTPQLAINWEQFITNGYTNKPKLIITPECIFAIDNYYNSSGDGDFFLKIGSKLYDYVPTNADGLYIAQIIKHSGSIYNSTVLHGPEWEYFSINLQNAAYNTATDELFVVVNTNNQGIYINNEFMYYENVDFIKIGVTNLTPTFTIDTESFNNDIPIFCTSEEVVGFSIPESTLQSMILHPDYSYNDLQISFETSPTVTWSIDDSKSFIINSYSKNHIGLDTIKISVKDPENNIVTEELYFYIADNLKFTWDSLQARRCVNTEIDDPDFYIQSFQIPDRLLNLYAGDFPYINTTSHYLDNGTSYEWYESIPVPGIYSCHINYDLNFNPEKTCYFSEVFTQYKVHAQPTLTHTIPETYCTSIDLYNYVSIPNGTFYIEENELEYNTYPFKDAFFNFPEGAVDYVLTYETDDDVTGCFISENLGVFNHTQAPNQVNLENYYSTCQHAEPIVINPEISNLIWYDDAKLTSVISTDETYTIPSAQTLNDTIWVLQSENGCESVPLEISVQIHPTPSITYTGKTILCHDEYTTKITLEKDPVISEENLQVYWNGIPTGSFYAAMGGDINPFASQSMQYSASHAFLEEGTHSIEIQDMYSNCYIYAEINITKTNILPPVTTDTTFIIGNPAPMVQAQGSNIRWFKSDESLVGFGNIIYPKIRTAGTYTFLATQSDEFCESLYDTAVVTILECPTTAPFFEIDTLQYCYKNEVISIQGPNNQTHWFEDNFKITSISADSTLSIAMPQPGTYTYYAAQYSSEFSCYSQVAPVTLIVHANPVIVSSIPPLSNEFSAISIVDYVYPQTGIFSGEFITNQTFFDANAAGEGIHIIHYTASNSNTCSTKIEIPVTVTIGSIPAQTVFANTDTVYLTINQTIQLTASVLPTNATQTKLVWESSNNTIADITALGICTMKTADTVFAIVWNESNPLMRDSILVIGKKPNAISFIPLPPLCENESAQKLTVATPAGGKYFGDFVLNNFFIPTQAGGHIVGYTYTDAFGNSDTAYSTQMVYKVFPPEISNVVATEFGEIPLLEAQGDSIVWYNSLLLTDTIQTGNTLHHGKASQGIYTFYAVQVAQGCVSEPSVAKLTILPCVLQKPSITATSIIRCESDTTLQSFDANAPHTVIWYDDNFEELHQGETFIPEIETIGSTVFYARQFDGSCYSAPVQVMYTLAKNPEITIDSPDSVLVGMNYSLVASVNSENSYSKIWKLQNQVIPNSSLEITSSASTEETLIYSLQVTDTKTMCSATESKKVVLFKDYIAVNAIDCPTDTIEIVKGFAKTVTATITPSYASLQQAIFESYTDIVSCSNASIHALKVGTTYVYVLDDKGIIHDSIFVRVMPYTPVSSIELPKSISLIEGASVSVLASVIPHNASFTSVEFIEINNQFISLTKQGLLTAKKEGVWMIEAVAIDGGHKTQSIVYITKEPVYAQEIVFPSEIHIVKGEQKTIPFTTIPAQASIEQFNFSVTDITIANILNNSIAGITKGNTILTAIHTVSLTEFTTNIRVTNSQAPICNPFPQFSMKQVNDSIVIPMALYAWDDSTSVENLVFEAHASTECTAYVQGMHIIIKPTSSEYIGACHVVVSVTDEELSKATSIIPIQIIEKQNEAPSINTDPIYIEFLEGFTAYNLQARVSDDFSKPEEISFTVVGTNNISTEIQNSTLIASITNAGWYGTDTISITATDRHFASTTVQIPVIITNKPNEAPHILPIPVQYNNDTTFFSYIELTQYVEDDFTSPSQIVWSCSPNANIRIKILNNIGFIQIINPYWSGAEMLTLTATDQHGATDSIHVLLVQEQARNQGWNNNPTVNFYADKQFGVPGDEISLYASLGGAETWQWEIPGMALQDSSKVIQTMSFSNPGTYSVILTAQNPDGLLSVIKEQYITIYGISERNPAICIGEELSLHITSSDMDSYIWNTGETSKSITINPTSTSVYSVTMHKGLFSFTDSVKVRVSVPVSIGNDTAICSNTSLVFDAGYYQSYLWNTGETSQTISAHSVGTYTVTTIDDIGCESTTSRSITELLSIPTIDLGPNQLLCDGEIALLDAGIGYSYVWSNNSKDQQVLVTTPQTMYVTITDKHMCSNSDTISIDFRYPFTEQIGVVTYSEKTNNIIIAWQRTPDKNTMKYEVYRETNIKDKWSFIGEVPYSELSVFEDSLSNYVMRAYRYGLVTIDSCGNRSPMSISHRSMHLQTFYDNGMNLRWSLYEPHDFVETYIIYRGTSLQNLTAIDSLPNDYFSWTDTTINPNMLYRVVFRLKETVNPKLFNSTKAESGPFIIALSNIAEATTSLGTIDFNATVFAYPTPVVDVLHIAIAGATSDRYTIRITNTLGSTMHIQHTYVTDNTTVSIPTNHWAQGTYNIQIFNSIGTKTLQIVK